MILSTPVGISKISKDQAAKLPNKTHAIPGDEGYYIAELDVFHNLHCLVCLHMISLNSLNLYMAEHGTKGA